MKIFILKTYKINSNSNIENTVDVANFISKFKQIQKLNLNLENNKISEISALSKAIATQSRSLKELWISATYENINH